MDARLHRGVLPRSLALVAGTLSCFAGAPEPPAPERWVVAEYEVSDAVLRNPERGLSQSIHITDAGDVAFVAGLGVSMATALIRLDDYRDRPLDDALLAELDAGFQRVRDADLKLVLRFQYNIGSGADPALPLVLTHIDQLAPLLHRNADVIAVMQAGFIGAWGEWHTSISGLTERAERSRILAHLLRALPGHRYVQVRSPVFKQEMLHDPRAAARIGHHNDCVLSDDTDRGTYPEPASAWRAYLEHDSRFVPVGGETCEPAPPRTDCEHALHELRRYHWSFLNRSYHPQVIAAWKQQGCYGTIARDLGYRLVARRARWPAAARAGDAFELELTVDNLGYAAPFNARPVYAVIGEGAKRREIELTGVDVRRWHPGRTHRITAVVELPDDLGPGERTLSLWMPDPAHALRGRPGYAIRLSNQRMWRPEEGTNLLGRLTVVD